MGPNSSVGIVVPGPFFPPAAVREPLFLCAPLLVRVWRTDTHLGAGVAGKAHHDAGQASRCVWLSVCAPSLGACACGGEQVRIQALVSLGELIPTLDKPCVMDILQTMARCASVDHSPPTLMCIVGVADVVQKEVGFPFRACELERLPALAV